MKDEPLMIGGIVRSRAGRDRGRTFVILEILDEQYVLLADGALRTVERPKKKKRKHLLKASDMRMELSGTCSNAEIRKFLSAVGFQNDRNE